MISEGLKKSGQAGAANILRNIIPRRLLYFFAVSTLTSPLSIVFAQGYSTVGNYENRLNRAKQAIDEVIERESPSTALVARMIDIKRALPADEEVEFSGSTIRVDNAWLHAALNEVIRNASGDIEQRRSMLMEISDRLANLQRSIKEAQKTPDQALRDQRAQLEKILARPEYQDEEKHQSALQSWIRKIREIIILFLERLFGGQREPGGGGAIFRILVFLTVIAALIFGAVKLAQYLHSRQRTREETNMEAREVLGEEIADDATAAALFAMATEMAQQGEYRKAIRRAYIALLCELEQRGKLRIHRSKTNRDYLDAMRPEQRIFPSFSVMTTAFEHVWYGQERATREEFQDFIALYQETLG